MRRLSVASLDSGAESPVYGEEPSASVGRGNPAARPPWADGGGLIISDEPAWLPAPPGAALPSAQRVNSERDITVAADRTPHGQVGPGVPRLIASYDMSVIDRHSGRWYVKDIRASTLPMGTQ